MRVEVSDDTASALALMEFVLSDGRPLAREYPQVFAPDASGRVVVAQDDGHVRSACAILPRVLVFPDGLGERRELKVGLIGSVSTHADCRRQGLASSVLDLAERELKEAGCLLSMLWADDPSFYEARGYQPIGLEVDYVLEKTLCSQLPAPTQVRSALHGDFLRLHQLYMTQDRRMDRTREESAALFSTPGMQIFVHNDGMGPSAYACLGRGHDLDGVVHEWAGEAEGVLACLRAHMESDSLREAGSPLFLMAAPGDQGVTCRLEELGAMCAPGVLGLGKILDIEGAGTLLAECCSVPLSFKQNRRGNMEVRHGSHSSEVSPTQWLELFLPAKGRCERLERIETQLNTRFASLPWAPFLWGLDSI
jgi:GNAT superfamily N-acetyltransferase